MPVDLGEHDPDDPITIRPETNKAKIIKLLYQDTNLGYTPAEIREALDLPRGSVSTTLSRMHDEGLIEKTSDGLYHGLDHRNDIRRFAHSLVSLETMLARHPEAGVDSDDVAQTGESAKQEIPPERLQESDVVHDEPSPSEWVVEESAEDKDE